MYLSFASIESSMVLSCAICAVALSSALIVSAIVLFVKLFSNFNWFEFSTIFLILAISIFALIKNLMIIG